MKKTILIGVVLIILAHGIFAVRINEFVSNPESGLGADEWVELANDGEPANLEGCFIEENGGQKTFLNGVIHDFFVIDDPKGMLNNDADFIRLVCPQFIDEVIYTGGVPGKGRSLGLDARGVWVEYTVPTKGYKNFEEDETSTKSFNESFNSTSSASNETPNGEADQTAEQEDSQEKTQNGDSLEGVENNEVHSQESSSGESISEESLQDSQDRSVTDENVSFTELIEGEPKENTSAEPVPEFSPEAAIVAFLVCLASLKFLIKHR
ncbi:MAG: hypothetical protein QXK37_04375 [Candidatus Woesearchaeota archaeon]